MECQESGCRHEAVNDWKGRRVCHDHYDMYHDQWEKMRQQE